MTEITGPREPVLSLRGVSKAFGAVQALREVDLDIYAGEVLAIVGDNGAGKSTLVKILAGVHPADEGSILMKGGPVRIASPADARRHGIATVFQDLALCNNLDVVSNLFLGNFIGKFHLNDVEMETRAINLLKQLSTNLPSIHSAVAGLSGGQRQTVAIARSLVGDPDIVILDEPTAALGVAQTAEVLNLIERLRERGHGVVLICHNMEDVRAVSDRIAILRLGRNNGTFDADDVSNEQLVGAITGATDNAVSRRASRKLGERVNGA